MMERRWEGWEGRRRKKGESWREGKLIRTDQKCQVQIQFWSLADICASPAWNNRFSWCEVLYIEMMLLGWSQTQSPVTKCRSSYKFGFQVSSDLRMLVSSDLGTGMIFTTAPCLYGPPFLPTSFLSCTAERGSSSFSLYPIALSLT